ncbi:MAG: hypothetical protein ACOC93_05240 [Planctomycetota bacterium]
MNEPIRVSQRHPSHWEYNGEPVTLLGGSVEDNLFQIPDLAEHLDTLVACGGNYVRCTMSSRDEGNVWPFERNVSGLYDLDRPGKEYWRRFRNFLELTSQRDVVVQLEVWATFDFYRAPWQDNPFNPAYNVNYSADQSGLREEVASHPVHHENPFFYTVPRAENNDLVLGYQRQFVDQLLAISLEFGNVLYCMDNETNVTPYWPWYWAEYIRDKAEAAGKHVEMTEMWDAHDLNHQTHRYTWEHPDLFSFVDVSQNNHQTGQQHWDSMQAFRRQLVAPVRPLNNVKVYGADGGRHGDTRDGIERFWRNVMGKMASARFHRPPSGLGLSELAQTHIHSARKLLRSIDEFRAEPHNELVYTRRENHAYCLGRPGSELAILFIQDEPLDVDTSEMEGEMHVRWLDIDSGKWASPRRERATDMLHLIPPFAGRQAAVIKNIPRL